VPASMKEETLQQALAAAREIEWEPAPGRIAWEPERVEALTELIPLLPVGQREMVLREALMVAQAIEKEWERSRAMMELAPHLPAPLLRQMLDAILKINDRPIRTRVLIEVMPQLPELDRAEAIYEALAAVQGIEEKESRSKMVHSLASHLASLPYATLARLWLRGQEEIDFLHTLARRSRQDLLSDLCALIPMIIALGGPGQAVEIFHAIQDVGRWWP